MTESLPDIYPNSIGDEAYSDFTPIVATYDDPDGHLWVYLHALGDMIKDVDDISKDGSDGEPGWSQIFDLERAKTEWLPWAGQLVGYHVPSKSDDETFAEYDAKQRERIVTRSSWRRGTISMMLDVINDQLNPPQRVIIQERYNGDPYTMKIWIYAPDIATSQAEITKAAQGQKMAGLLFELGILTTVDSYDVLRASNASYTIVKTDYPTYYEVTTNTDKLP